jgi:hypothetical protein
MVAVGRNRGLRDLEASSLVQTTSRWILLVALLVVAYNTWGPIAVGVVGVVRTVPALATVPVAAVTDGRRRERVLAVLAASRMVAAAVAAVALAVDVPLILFVAAGWDAFAGTLRRPVQSALLPSLARTPEELVSANIATSFGDNIGGLVGPVIGGVLLVVAGPTGALAAASLGFAIATLLVLGVRDVHPGISAMRTWRHARSTTGVRSLAAGTRDLAGRPGVRLVGLLLLHDAFLRGALGASIVVFAVQALGHGGAVVGILTGVVGLGGIVGVGLALSLLTRPRLGVPLVAALIAAGLGVGLFGLSPTVVVAAAFLLVVGAAGAVVSVAAATLLQRTLKRSERTRILVALEGFAEATIGIGALVASVAVDTVGVRPATVASGIIVAAATAVVAVPLLRWAQTIPLPGPELDLVRETPLFAGLPLDVIEELAGLLVPMGYRPGDRIITEGDVGDALYLIADGSVDVRVGTHHVATLGPGAAVGEIALLRRVPRTATVEAHDPVIAYRLDAASFVAAVTGTTGGLRAAVAVVDAYGEGAAAIPA